METKGVSDSPERPMYLAHDSHTWNLANHPPQINDWLQKNLIDWDSCENWTSKLRTGDGYPEFDKKEWKYTDFTYRDGSGAMRALLQEAGVQIMPEWSTNTVYHLEVKSTPGGCRERPFIVSKWQRQKVSLVKLGLW
jgi:hypothetical protein